MKVVLFSILITALLWLLCPPVMGQMIELSAEEPTRIPAQPYIYAPNDTIAFEPSSPEDSALTTYEDGLPRTKLWFPFHIRNNSEQVDWYLNTTNSVLAKISLGPSPQTTTAANGYLKQYPFDLTNGLPVQLPLGATTTIWVQVESPHVAESIIFTLYPKPDYERYQFNYVALVLVAIGAMLALTLYNAFLFFPTRDSSLIWYAAYQGLCIFCWVVQFKLMLYSFELELSHTSFYLAFFMAGATSLMFALHFLKLNARLGWILRGIAVGLVLIGILGLWMPFYIYTLLLNICVYAWMILMLSLGVYRYRQNFVSARFYVAGFTIMSIILTLALISNLSKVHFITNYILWALWAQLIDALALALALADRITLLRKSRQHADKRALTDQLTGLPNRMAFERDVREWEAYVNDGKIEDFCLTFIDVDGLKAVNDYQGHNKGDRLLLVVANWLQTKLNSHNLYRIGGDEFLVLSKESVDWRTETLQKILENAGFKDSGLSMGTSSYQETGSRSKLLALADERMYAVKKQNKAARG